MVASASGIGTRNEVPSTTEGRDSVRPRAWSAGCGGSAVPPGSRGRHRGRAVQSGRFVHHHVVRSADRRAVHGHRRWKPRCLRYVRCTRSGRTHLLVDPEVLRRRHAARADTRRWHHLLVLHEQLRRPGELREFGRWLVTRDRQRQQHQRRPRRCRPHRRRFKSRALAAEAPPHTRGLTEASAAIRRRASSDTATGNPTGTGLCGQQWRR